MPGVSGPARRHRSTLANQIVRATAGHPLALSLAADLAVQHGVWSFPNAPAWRLTLRGLVEQLLRDVDDADLVGLVEGAAIVRQFDEATLAAVTGRDEIGPSFGRLCQLSVVQPAERGMMLHDDVRRVIVDDLGWRHPDRVPELRLRAMAYYRQRMTMAVGADREWLLAERLFLWENSVVQAMLLGRRSRATSGSKRPGGPGRRGDPAGAHLA